MDKFIEKTVKFGDFDNICRFCFTANNALNSIFKTCDGDIPPESSLTNITNILNEFFGLEIYVGDGLPQSICDICRDKLIICHDFWKQCHSATKVLKTTLEEHLNSDREMKFEFCTEVVYLEQEHDNVTQDDTVRVSNLETVTIESSSKEDVGTTTENKPKKRVRKKPEYQHCYICGLRCRYLNRHIGIMHSNGTKYECDICKTYCARSKGQLYIHMGTKHINKVKTEFACNVCDRHFKNLKKLSNHMAAKHPARRHPCGHCHLVFKSERTLNRHQSIHTGERNFICEECGKSFRQTETLRNHQLRHFPPTVPCPHCDKMFYVKSQLRNHEGIHTGMRPWQCDICSASFVASSGLTVHRNKHKKDNLFPVCKLCGEQFNDRLNLRMHVNDHRRSLI